MTKFTKIFLGTLILAAVFIWAAVVKSPNTQADSNVHLYFLNVGQGDSELIEKGDYQILIDAGPDDSVLPELGKVMPLTDRKIDVVILTHPHADHLVGLNSIIDRYEIGKIYYSGAKYDSNGYAEFLDKTKNKNVSLEVPELGEKIVPFENSEFTFLWPGKKYEGSSADNPNNVSEVGRFCYFNQCALFTGDIETDEQEGMFNYYALGQNVAAEKSENSQPPSNINPFQSDILKISHHGSSNGTNQQLLDIVQPKIAIIEVGANNKFGHPHASTLELLQNAKIQQYCTDKDGTIDFVFNEFGYIKK